MLEKESIKDDASVVNLKWFLVRGMRASWLNFHHAEFNDGLRKNIFASERETNILNCNG